MTDYKIIKRDPSKVYPKFQEILVGDSEETLVIYGDNAMTDYGELVKRLREHAENMYVDFLNEAADALEAQAKEIAKKDARIAELEAALTPLAEMDYWIEPHHDAHDSIEQCNQLTVAEILAASAALKGEK